MLHVEVVVCCRTGALQRVTALPYRGRHLRDDEGAEVGQRAEVVLVDSAAVGEEEIGWDGARSALRFVVLASVLIGLGLAG